MWSMDEGLQIVILLLCMLPVPQNSSPTLRRTEAEFRNGFVSNSRVSYKDMSCLISDP